MQELQRERVGKLETMKALPTRCSKLIIDKPKDVGFSCFFRDLSRSCRAQLCLFPSKDVRIRFLHLLSPPHTRLQPLLLSSSPDSQVDLENIETQPEPERLWDPESALPLTWSEGHVWTAELDIPVGVPVHFKFFLKTCTGNLLWQRDPDRILESNKTENIVIVCEDWDIAENQKVIEEEPIANEDGPLLDSEIAIVAENLTPPKEELVPETNPTSSGKEQLQALSEESATVNGDTSLDNPLAIVAENISYPTEELIATADNGVLGSNKTNYPNDEAVDVSNMNVLVAEDLGDNDRVETVDALVAYEGKPVLVPGLSPLETMSPEEPIMCEDEKNSTTDALVGVNKALNHKLSEPEEKQEPESAVFKEEKVQLNQHIEEPPVGEEEQQLNQHIQEAPVGEEEQQLNQQIQEALVAEPDPSNLLQSDVQWSRNALQKLLNGLRFL